MTNRLALCCLNEHQNKRKTEVYVCVQNSEKWRSLDSAVFMIMLIYSGSCQRCYLAQRLMNSCSVKEAVFLCNLWLPGGQNDDKEAVCDSRTYPSIFPNHSLASKQK